MKQTSSQNHNGQIILDHFLSFTLTKNFSQISRNQSTKTDFRVISLQLLKVCGIKCANAALLRRSFQCLWLEAGLRFDFSNQHHLLHQLKLDANSIYCLEGWWSCAWMKIARLCCDQEETTDLPSTSAFIHITQICWFNQKLLMRWYLWRHFKKSNCTR